MALALVDDCNEYIVAAGMSCYDYCTLGLAPDDARQDVADDMLHFANGLSPTICDFINSFVNSTTGMWTAIIQAADAIIDAVKQALKDPDKLRKAVDKMVALAEEVLGYVKQIAEFLVRIPNMMNDFAFAHITEAIAKIQAYANSMQEAAAQTFEEQKARLLAKLQEKLDNAANSEIAQELQEKIDELRAKTSLGIVELVDGLSLAWPEMPDLVFGLGETLTNLINAIDIPIPSLKINMKLSSGGDLINDNIIQSKLESVAEWTNTKVAAVNDMLEPFVTSYNTVLELVSLLLSSDLMGVLKWLLAIPKKLIDTYLNAAKFAIEFVVGLAQLNPLLPLESWAEEKLSSMVAGIEEKAQAIDPDSGFNGQFVREVVLLFQAMVGGLDDLGEYVTNRAECIGPIYGSIIQVASRFYGALLGGLSYLISVIVADAEPLLGLIGMSAAMFAPTVNMEADPDRPANSRAPIVGDEEFLPTTYWQEDGNGVLLQLQEDTLGAPIPINVDGTVVAINDDGIRPIDPDRPIQPHGWFWVNAEGIAIRNEDGDRIRTDVTEVTESINGIDVAQLPLGDPTIQKKLNNPDITKWRRFSNLWMEEDLPITERTYDDTGAVDQVVGRANVQNYEYISFMHIPQVGAPQSGLDVNIDMSQYTVSGQTAADLAGGDLVDTPDPTDEVQRYQGIFFYRKIRTYTEVSNSRRTPIGPETRVLNHTTGKYNFTNISNGLELYIDYSHVYSGPFRRSSYGAYSGVARFDYWRDPREQDVFSVFYMHDTISPEYLDGFYTNKGKIYLLDEGGARIGLFGNALTNIECRPARSEYPWNSNYDVPNSWKFDNHTSAGYFDDHLGGKQFSTVEELDVYTTIVSGTITVAIDLGVSSMHASGAQLNIQGPEDEDFVVINMPGKADNANRQFVADYTPPTESGIYRYYYTVDIPVYGKGYFGTPEEPLIYEVI